MRTWDPAAGIVCDDAREVIEKHRICADVFKNGREVKAEDLRRGRKVPSFREHLPASETSMRILVGGKVLVVSEKQWLELSTFNCWEMDHNLMAENP